MNNLLRIFLIFNLISSTTSSVNNFSIPLSDKNFATGSNSSEVVERQEPKEPITLYGGFGVIGLTFSKNPPLIDQRPCSLSFPVVKHGGYKGFLTSRVCANSDIFVKDTKVGEVGVPGDFNPLKGLDYIFVDVYPEYWSEKISRNVTYPHCDNTGSDNTFIPLLPTPEQFQSHYPGSEVCTYGGTSGYVCGEIVDFNAEIKVWNPIEGEDTQFYPVVKVQMEKPYSFGDLGAPVYIPLPVPYSNQFVASPVGQVVEAVGNSSEKNIWYYIPIDRILKDGELEIVFGDLTSLAKGSSNEDSNNASLSDNLTTNSNASKVTSPNQFDKRQLQVLLTYGGLKVSFSSGATRLIESTAKNCTLGFPVTKNQGPPRSRFDHGFLTIGSCQVNQGGTNGIFHVRPSLPDPDVREIIRLGSSGSTTYGPILGLSFNVIRLLPNDNQHLFWDDNISASVKVPGGFADIIAQQYIPSEGTQVCFWGSYSGHMCGTVVDPSASLSVLNPWNWPIYLERIREGRIFDLFSPDDNFRNLIKVRLNNIPRAYFDNVKEDRGAPVYFPDNINQITRVQPVGILLDYVIEIERQGDQCVMIPYMYCASVDRFLLNYGPEGYQLIGENG